MKRSAVVFLSVIAIIAAFFLAASAYRQAQWREQQHIGEVVSAAEDRIVISDVRGRERTVRMSEQTVIRKGRTTVGPPEVGDRLMVIGKNENGSIDAVLIRILDNKGPLPPEKPR
ncbi:hypothetical protein A2852_01910 [Candidatus Adlerbacteria bacterium RIFCSPHIGHO2_01_FULL_54_23]|uniref:DUF5666 domain-containing protein n=3 Tax=Candidatus Adleribacteriota TaxID=1752736 RepID=A0A1F4XZI9_9BACT|nr:MAG: hypothetical protein UY83_C0005G0009 [Candidatus Adlerbacteria bacterium GW2011_GWA1_54_10]KKW36121.1 MAG: hypothetical protein UY84_C0001G0009 [Candidatus Adlerbacteria bacterium GW2011_GWA2_54_12]KKW37425.1 MAG: hypothetical protein UY86_C0009G0059 [Candidatus Adlerbacteria bacterium GW2011_GWB1_54_7]OGC79087.1 MAG: hypothetical protein A2852_01910 [Candidatus Adlerbacteria bacterium RIFCSPHIGHO2_01_FULL_54_23]OGC87018.1 MAG: hypothetical protein A3B33_02990 [Candidatus Adlerbacteria 